MEDCLFDSYKALTDECIEDAKKAGKDVPGLYVLQRHLRQTRPYILTEAVVKIAMEMAYKAGSASIPYTPFLKLPFWIEFDGGTVGSDGESFAAIIATPDPKNPKHCMVQLLCENLVDAKSLYFDLSIGHWEFEQFGPCSGIETCQLARETVEGEPYRITKCVAEEWMPKHCACALAGHLWAQFVNALNHLLSHRKEPLLEHITEREVALPYPRDTKLKREKIANSEAKKRSRANITTISLSAPVQVSRRAKSSTGAQTEQDMEKMSVEGYWKVLIPGEGKPWKKLQIVPVASYERRQKPAEVRDRVRVEV